ncbi:MAG: DUF3253 domain-containing protein [Sphingobacteriaceae bacterium]|nr:MAG: DUF3253 domain-containing protein [Sphingobacteriaceae bacterium]
MSERDIQQKIIEMATNRGAEKTICPSEVAREMFGDDWRSAMQAVREAAFDLALKNKVVVTQKGKAVDPETLKGPIRIRIQQLKVND